MCSISYKFVKTCFRYLLEVFNMPQGEGNGTPLQYCCLENRMDGGAWYAAVHGVARSRTWLSDFTFTFYFHALEKEMATHSSVLAWRIPWTEKPGRLQSMGSHRVGHNWSDLAAWLVKILSVNKVFLYHITEISFLWEMQISKYFKDCIRCKSREFEYFWVFIFFYQETHLLFDFHNYLIRRGTPFQMLENISLSDSKAQVLLPAARSEGTSSPQMH